MSNPPALNVLVTGMNWSGSGALVGLLREYKGFHQISGGRKALAPAGYAKMGEFNDFREPGGIGDLVAHPEQALLKRLEASAQFRRRYQYPLATIWMLMKARSFAGIADSAKQYRELSALARSVEQLSKSIRNLRTVPEREEAARAWIRMLTTKLAPDARAAIFDQPINVGQHIDIWPRVFAPFKLFVVFRDPRDQFAEMDLHGYLTRGVSTDLSYVLGWGRHSAASAHKASTLSRMRYVTQLMESMSPNKVFAIAFEELVIHYDASREKIQQFLGLTDQDHCRRGEFFDPSWSIRNIGVHKSAPSRLSDEELEPLMQWYRSMLREAA